MRSEGNAMRAGHAGMPAEGTAGQAELERLEALCDMVKHTSLCGLGQSAPNPVLSTLRYFREEYTALIRDGASSAPGPAGTA